MATPARKELSTLRVDSTLGWWQNGPRSWRQTTSGSEASAIQITDQVSRTRRWSSTTCPRATLQPIGSLRRACTFATPGTHRFVLQPTPPRSASLFLLNTDSVIARCAAFALHKLQQPSHTATVRKRTCQNPQRSKQSIRVKRVTASLLVFCHSSKRQAQAFQNNCWSP